MVINFCGEGCFKVQTTGGTTLLTEGFGEMSVRLKPDIFVKTGGENQVAGAGFVVGGPGEYEITGIEIKGYPRFVYLIRTEEMKLGYLGPNDIKEPAFDAAVTEKLQDVDVLFIPDSVEGAKIARQFHPKVVISQSGDAKELEKELGKKAEILDKLVIKKKEVPAGELGRLICLKV